MGDAPIDTAGIIDEEVMAQTKVQPVSCRPSRFGANALTGKMTWIISFLAPVRPFRLFNTSDLAKEINKKPAISRHDPGCQSFCNPARCVRYARCSNCGTRKDQHPGPSGVNCTEKPRCANCHGPFPAGHDSCPAAPKRKGDALIKLTKKQLDIIRRHSDRVARNASLASETPQPEATQPQAQTSGPAAGTTPSQSLRKRTAGARITEYEQSGPRQRADGREPRSTATARNLNLAKLSANSLKPDTSSSRVPNGAMDVDTTTTATAC